MKEKVCTPDFEEPLLTKGLPDETIHDIRAAIRENLLKSKGAFFTPEWEWEQCCHHHIE